jgi:hypothetical protein
MTLIKTMVDEATYKKLVKLRKKEGVPSVSALFLKRCDLLTDDKEADEIVKKALRAAKKRESGDEFRLRDLFPAEQWSAWTKGARLRAGRMFQDQIGTATYGIRASHRSGSNHQFYVVS